APWPRPPDRSIPPARRARAGRPRTPRGEPRARARLRRPASRALRQQLGAVRFAQRAQVAGILQDAAERGRDRLGVEVIEMERYERPRPVERIGDAGRLLQAAPAKRLHETRDLVRQPLVHSWDARLDDTVLILVSR